MKTIEDMPEDKFGPQPVIRGAPVHDDEALQNIRSTLQFDLPLFAKKKPMGGSAIFVAAGPSLRQYLPEIKRRHDAGEFLITCNHTYDYLQTYGITCDACLLIDPREENKDCVKLAKDKTTFYVAAVCTPELFRNLLTQGAHVQKMLVAYGMSENRDLDLQKQLYPGIPVHDYLVGGTMTPLRAMPFTVMLGLSKLEFYGFDSCFFGEEPVVLEGDPRYIKLLKSNGGVFYTDQESNQRYVIDEPEDGGFFYAFKKPRPESLSIVLTSDGRRFLTTPGLGNQARQICKWVDRLDGTLSVEIHGDSLSSNMLRIHRENQARVYAEIGDRRWTEEYAAQQRELHELEPYGVWGDHDLEVVARMVSSMYCRTEREITVLNYGAGNGSLAVALQALFKPVNVTNYDPFHPLWRNDPEPGLHDITVCTDVMEHIEEQCVDNTLKYMAERTRAGAIFTISLNEAGKNLPNGRNAHITLKPAKWWVAKISRYFVPVEGATNDEGLLLICQKQDAKQQLETMREAA